MGWRGERWHLPLNRWFALLLVVLTPLALALPAGFQQQTIVSGNLTNPVVLFELPDGRMVVVQKSGRFFRFNPAAQPASISPYMHITDIDVGGERGVNGVALDPDFAQNGYFYVYYTHKTSKRNRISRFTHNGNTGDLSSELLLWQDNEDWSDCCHYGGGIAFGPDGKLYLATGEEFDGAQAQDLARAGGKVIRINKDGSIPADNPFVDGAGGNLDEIWAYGLRNPFRAHWDLVANRFYIGEVGGNVQETAREDLHVGRAGANFGWPYCEGSCGNPAWDDPVFDYAHTGSTPAGGAIVAGFSYYGTQFPATYNGKFFFSDYTQGWIKYLSFNGDGSLAGVHSFADEFIGAIVYLMQGSDGSLYYVDILGSVGRIAYSSGNQAPVITAASGTPNTGAAPLTVNFTAAATDAEGDPLTYRWIFGDGGEATGASVSHTYTQTGIFTAYVQVSDGSRTTLSNPLPISIGNAPVVTINTPLEGTLFRAGNQIAFSGTAADPDETIPAANYSWEILFVHNAHTHPVLEGHTGTGGTLEINSSGHDYHDTTAYQITLTVTDSDGLTGSDTVTVYPDKVNLNLATLPAGLPVLLDGVQLSTPIAYDTMIGFQHVVSVQSSVCVNGTSYIFQQWSDGGALSHTMTVPDQAITLTAQFAAAGTCGGAVLPAEGLVLHLEADAGVVSTEAVVTQWRDQSGNNNHLNYLGDPQLLLTGSPSGAPVIDFDGDGDRLQRTGGFTGLPTGAADRTVITLLNYRSAGYGGFAYGQVSLNKVFGNIVDAQGNLMTQAWGNNNDVATTTAGTGAGWLVQSSVVQGNQLTQYRDGQLIGSRARTYATGGGRIVLGAEIDYAPHLSMQVAAVLVYDRALSAQELESAQGYLQNKYLATSSGNQPPVAAADSASVSSGGNVTIAVLANDSDPEGALAPASVTIVSQPTAGSVTVNANGTVIYTHNGSAVATDGFTYRVADAQGVLSNVAAVSVTIAAADGAFSPQTCALQNPGNPDACRVEMFDGSTLGDTYPWFSDSGASDPTGIFTVQNGLLHVSGNGLGALISNQRYRDYTMVLEFKWGTQTWGPRAGKAKDAGLFVHSTGVEGGYDGIWMPGLQVQIGDGMMGDLLLLEGEDANGNIVPMAYTATTDQVTCVYNTWNCRGGYRWKSGGTSRQFDQPLGTAHWTDWDPAWRDVIGFRGANDPDSPDGEWNQMVVVADGSKVTVYVNGIKVNEATAVSPASGKVQLEVEWAEFYVRRWELLPLDGAPAPIRPLSITSAQLPAATAGAAYSQQLQTIGGSGQKRFTISSGQLPGGMSLNGDTGAITGTPTAAGNFAFTVTVMDQTGWPDQQALSITVASTGTPALPGDGLVLHLEGDSGVESTGGLVTLWRDQSPSQNHLAGVGDPRVSTDTPSGAPVIDFDGSGARLERLSGLVGLPTGAANRTVILLANYRSNGYGGFAWGQTTGNKAFGTIVDAQGRLMAQAWGNAYDAATTVMGNGAGWLIQTAMVQANQLSHYQGTQLIGSRTQTYATASNRMVLGAELDANPHLSMQVAAVLVYNRALSQAERESIYSYLQQKYLSGGGSGNQAPVAQPDKAMVTASGAVVIPVSTNDVDPEGALDPTSVVVVSPPTLGTVTSVGDGSLRYTHAGSGSAQDSFSYTVADVGGRTSAPVTVTIDIAAPVPASGLVLWLEGSAGVQRSGAGAVTEWFDQSSSANHVTAGGTVQWLASAFRGRPAIDLDGISGTLRRNGTLAGFPLAAGNRAIYLVTSYRSNGYGGFGYGATSCNGMFGLGVNPQGRMMVQGWCSDFLSNQYVNGAGVVLQSSTLAANVLKHYRNGTLISQKTHTFATTEGPLVLGSELDGAPFVSMQVAEILVFNRALSAAEHQAVTTYLYDKYVAP